MTPWRLVCQTKEKTKERWHEPKYLTGIVKLRGWPNQPKIKPPERQKRLTCSPVNQAKSNKRKRQPEFPRGNSSKYQPTQRRSTSLRTRSGEINLRWPNTCWHVPPKGKTVKREPEEAKREVSKVRSSPQGQLVCRQLTWLTKGERNVRRNKSPGDEWQTGKLSTRDSPNLKTRQSEQGEV